MNLPQGLPDAGLPVPDPAALEYSRRLCRLIRSEIDAVGGVISFRRYMELALYAPGLGYYSAGAARFGKDGDFVTAPEISPLFGASLARQCAEVLAQTGGVILEFGAGSGALSVALLGSLRELDSLPAEYWILELSADLRQQQQERLRRELPGLAARVRWLDALPAEPVAGVFLANEVLDAMPVHRVRMERAGFVELGVGRDGAEFGWRTMPCSPEVAAGVERRLGPLGYCHPEGYVTEFNLDLDGWVRGISDVLARGSLILVDYGYTRREYYHPDRSDGTLVCHYRHRVHWDPFVHPGLQDISASVDFTAVAEAAADAALAVAGFTTQANFLMGCGLHELAALQPEDSERHRLEVARQVKVLTLPGEMGERFQVMALNRGLSMHMRGFSGPDHRRRL